jgi:spore germination protein KC
LPSRTEISEYDVVEIAGLDRCEEDPSLVEITMVSRLKAGASGGGGGKDLITIISDKGSTLFEAQRKLKANAARRLFFGYVDFFLIGEAAAKENLTKYFDITERDHEIRKSAKVYIVKGGTAKELLYSTNSEDKFITDKLDSIKKDVDFLSNTNETEIIQVAGMLDNSSLIIPALIYKDFEKTKIIGKMPDKNIKTSGYAVFKNAALTGYINEDYARGYNFIVNEVGSCPVNARDENGKLVCFEVTRAITKIYAAFNDDKINSVIINTHIVGNIPEQQSEKNILNKSSLEKMTKEVSLVIENEMSKAVNYSQAVKVDCLRLGQRLKLRYPYKWKKIEPDWEKLYPEIDVKFEVDTHLVLTYDIQKPAGSKGE